MAPKRTRAAAQAAAGGAAASGGTPAVSQASSSGSGSGLAALAARGTTKANKVKNDIEELLAAQKKVRDERKRLATEVKNARRRRSRLTKRARLLTTEDLLTVVALREGERVADLVGSATTGDDAEACELPAEAAAKPCGLPYAEGDAAAELQDASSQEPELLADAERG